jgi:hypothetical protein
MSSPPGLMNYDEQRKIKLPLQTISEPNSHLGFYGGLWVVKQPENINSSIFQGLPEQNYLQEQ